MNLQYKGRDQTSLTEQKIANSHWSFYRICETLHIAVTLWDTGKRNKLERGMQLVT